MKTSKHILTFEIEISNNCWCNDESERQKKLDDASESNGDQNNNTKDTHKTYVQLNAHTLMIPWNWCWGCFCAQKDSSSAVSMISSISVAFQRDRQQWFSELNSTKMKYEGKRQNLTQWKLSVEVNSKRVYQSLMRFCETEKSRRNIFLYSNIGLQRCDRISSWKEVRFFINWISVEMFSSALSWSRSFKQMQIC
jgi:hypothetical protein